MFYMPIARKNLALGLRL